MKLVTPRSLRAALVFSLLATALLAQEPGGKASEDELSFVAMGDWGAAGVAAPNQLRVRDGLRAFLKERPVGFFVLLGDNFYKDGVASVEDPQWRTKFADVYTGPEFAVPFYPTLGNHDYDGSIEAQLAYAEVDRRWRLKPLPYTHRHGGTEAAPLVEFFMIDTNRWLDSRRERVDRRGKLRRLLGQSRALWKIVCAHHPVYSNGEDGDERLLVSVLRPVLVEHEVAFYMSGHHHNLQLLGAREGRERDKTVYLVSGGGGATKDPLEKEEGSAFQLSAHGFAHLTLSPSSARVRFVDETGKVRFDGRIPRREGIGALETAAPAVK